MIMPNISFASIVLRRFSGRCPGLVLFVCMSLISAEVAGASRGCEPPRSPRPTASAPPPWPVLLGAKVALCQRNRPVVSRVVLVPDPDTWLHEVARWSPLGQWPVLFESDPRAGAFIRAFQPDEIVRVPPTDRRLPADPTPRKSLMLAAAKIAWGAVEPGVTQRQIFEALGWRPPGFVVTAADDPAWPAAVALAAGRGLPLAFIEDELGPVGGELSETALRGFERRLQAAAEATGYEWENLGDDLDAIAICRTMPGRCRTTPPASARVEVPGRPSGDGPYATIDALARNANGDRWAYAGWIFGDEARSASMAMSSLFLQRRNVWLVSGYPKTGGWANYGVEKAAVELAESGYASMFFEGEKASIREWRRLLLGTIPPDMLYLNSHGNPNEFHLFQDARALPQDMPFCERPMTLSMVHSFSLQQPDNPETVGGRALRRGVYAYIGSVDEPYLSAFIPPSLQILRLRAGVPFLLAGRWWPNQGTMSGIWKITTIGDPFMIAPPPDSVPIPWVAADQAPPVPGAISVIEDAKAAMKSLEEDPARAGEAIRLLVMLGQDEIALQLWDRLVADRNLPAVALAAPEVLDPLFRARRWQEFLQAYERVPRESRDSDARDMLWHLLTPRLSSIRAADTIMLLRSEIRDPQVEVDLEILMPHLDRVLGDGAGVAEVVRRIDAAPNPRRRAALQKLR